MSSLFPIVFSAADTIVALSTPPGRSAIGVIRLSGSRSLELARLLVRDDSFRPKPTNVVLRNIYDPVTDDRLDQGLITYFETGLLAGPGEETLAFQRRYADIVVHEMAHLIEPTHSERQRQTRSSSK